MKWVEILECINTGIHSSVNDNKLMGDGIMHVQFLIVKVWYIWAVVRARCKM